MRAMITRRQAGLGLAAAAVATSAPAAAGGAIAQGGGGMATYVLVHGGGSGGWVWRRLAPLLRAAGHEAHTPTMTGSGERSHLLRPDVGLDTHIEDIVQVLKFEDLSNVILVGHSYGGMVITGVADRALERIGQLVYLDASHPHDGESLVDLTPEIMAFAKQDLRKVNDTEVVLGPGTAAVASVSSTDQEIFAWEQSHRTAFPWKCFTDKLRLAREAAVMKIPRTNINCTRTLAMRPADKRQRALEGDHVWEIDTTHDLMVTRPKEVAEMLLRLA
jgi:pimeloyl-ACP methyl ester carboxylesterase